MRTNIVTTWLFGAVNGHGAFYIKETNKEVSVRFLDPLIYGLQHEFSILGNKYVIRFEVRLFDQLIY